MKGIIGKKLGMTQIFNAKGLAVPVTVLQVGPNKVIQLKTEATDGYSSAVVAFEEIKENKLNKAQLGAYKKANAKPARYIKEISADGLNVGDEIKADIFKEGDIVDVSGISKGHGFSGTIKRWNAHRLKMTHGVGPVHREVGSMGANSTPAHVLKGKKMPGQYGHEKVTVLNLEVVKVDLDKNVILVKGAVPGAKNSLVIVRSAIKKG